MNEQTNRLSSSGWTAEQKASLIERLRPYEKGEGLVDWKAARANGVLAGLLADYGKSEKTVRSYYNYTFRRHAWLKKRITKRKYTPRNHAPVAVKEQVVQQPKPVKVLKHCPNCGESLMAYHAAANLNHG